MNRRTAGAWLLVLGVVLVIAGAIAWTSENKRVDDENGVGATGAALFGTPYSEEEANHAPSVVLFVIGGASALFGMLLIAGSPGARAVEVAQPPQSPQASSPGPDETLTEQLARLSAMHQRGELSDGEYAEAKRRVLGSSGSAPP